MAAPIYLVDGSGYIFRAFYAIQALSAPDGFPTNALYGFTRMLVRLLERADATHTAIVFDAGRKTFRSEIFGEYKANRKECPEDLVPQMPYFRQISSLVGTPVLELPGYEADDIIGTLAKRLSRAGRQVVIVSGDKDLLQLVDDTVSVWDTLYDKRYGPREVKEKLGVAPDKVVELLALTGDSSDNIPGLEGVGPKTAVQLIEKFGSTETLLSSIAALEDDASIRNRKKIAKQLTDNPEVVRVSRKLAQIDCGAPVTMLAEGVPTQVGDLSDEELVAALERSQVQTVELQQLFERFNFTSLIEELRLIEGVASSSVGGSSDVRYRVVTAENRATWRTALEAASAVALQIESTGEDPLTAKMIGVGICFDDNEAWFLPVAEFDGELDREALDALVPMLGNERVAKYCHDSKRIVAFLRRANVVVRGIVFDAMLAAYLLQPDKNNVEPSVVAQQYLDAQSLPCGRFVPTEDLASAVERLSWGIAGTAFQGAQGAHCTWLLQGVLVPKLEAEELARVYYELEIPLAAVLAVMELTGIAIDTELLDAMSHEFEVQLEHTRKEIYAIAGTEFNINSPKQLAEILFSKLALPTKGVKRTKTGISTDSSVLEKLSVVHPLPAHLLHYRFLHKLKSTYIDALPSQISPITGRLHTRFNQAVTGTGRLSSSEPNLQNIPIQSAEGARIRAAFVASPGWQLISADYSQIELRVLAHLSEDPNLIDAFRQELDIHARTARELLRIPAGREVSASERRLGKTMNFGIIYGMGPFRLARELGISLPEANEYIHRYFAHFSGVRSFFDALEHQARRDGFVRTLMGRKRVLESIDTSGRDQGFLTRAAVNAPIQGSAADIIKLAMVAIATQLVAQCPQVRMLLQIHDELVFECQDAQLAQATALIRATMENVLPLRIPLKVDIGSGANWQVAHG